MSGIDVKDSTVDYSVIKVWEDSESADGTVGSGAAEESSQGNRPSQIQVQLVGDGEVKETVTLNAANNWRYTWKGLAASVDWKVVEKEVPEGYRVASELQDTTFVITNTEIPEEQEEPTTEQEEPTTEPTEPTTEPEQPTTQITEPSTEPATSAPKTAEIPEKLPQTGALRWPIPVLTVVGILLFTAGWFRYRRHAHGENAHEKKR
jgi:outer membrane biosynthesis protein TonB